MIDSTKRIVDATPLDDILGLKLPKNKSYTLKEIYIKEAENIAEATIKYLSSVPTKNEYIQALKKANNKRLHMFN